MRTRLLLAPGILLCLQMLCLRILCLQILCLQMLCLPAAAQQVPLPCPSFEKGAKTPEGWRLVGGAGAWKKGAAADGKRFVSVSGRGEDASFWETGDLPGLTASGPDAAAPRLYRLTFRARRRGGGSGTAVSGPRFCNRDLGVLPETWTRFTSVFAAPVKLDPGAGRLRFGQWHVNGEVAFDDVSLTVARAIHGDDETGSPLGAGERLDGDRYTFEAPFASESTNLSRPLARHHCGFNTNRWTFGAGNWVVYRHAGAGRKHRRGGVEVGITYHRAGALVVEARAADKPWRRLGLLEGLGTKTLALPDDLFPCQQIEVRLRAEGERVNLQVSGYAFRSRVDGEPAQVVGRTRVVGVLEDRSPGRVTVLSLGEGRPGGRNRVRVRVAAARPSRVVRGKLRLFVAGQAAGEATFRGRGEAVAEIDYALARTGRIPVEVRVDRPRFRAAIELRVPDSVRADYGLRLPAHGERAILWWAASGWKVNRRRPPPRDASPVIRVRAARNECEAVQLVVHPREGLPILGLHAAAGTLTGPGGAQIGAGQVTIRRVRYVDVAQPTDPTGAVGPWPDPLPPLTRSIDVPAGRNQPLWVEVRVPREAKAGVYRGVIRLTAVDYHADVRMQLEVYDFTLPDRMTCKTAFGFSAANVWRYHGLKSPADRRKVLERYLACLARHHISPYDPAPLDPVRVTWPARSETDPRKLVPTFEWTAWDAAMSRAFNYHGFNSFRLRIPGLGGGSFHRRWPPELLGHKEGSPQYRALFAAYCREVEAHLKAKGWLDEAFVYWFDEPAPRDYAFVMNGFKKLREAAPGLPRMLTEQPEPALVGGPTLWCPVSYQFDPSVARKRMAAGETFWWYVCTGPKAPYCTLFIDHPGTELRVWLWQTWQRGITGVLVWQTNYWTSSAAYPDPKQPQNPYLDPMGWTSGYSTPEGTRRPWGNGDGRFLYPPEAAADGRPESPVFDPPVPSIRLAMLRDGLEDYEYLVILRRLLAEKGKKLKRGQREKFQRLLLVPPEITESMTVFTRRPEPILRRRDQIARAIATLRAVE